MIKKVALLAVALMLMSLTVPVAASAQAGDGLESVVHAGHATRWLQSPSDTYEMFFFGDSMALEQHLSMTSVVVWGTPQHDGSPSGAMIFMQSDGNAVLRSKTGHALWSTHTAGTGANNRLVLSDSGALSVYTQSGRRVWSAGTGPTMLRSGSVLKPGQSLRSCYDDSTPWASLTMRRDGNLVLTYAGHERWSSHTNVAGSRLVGRADGDWDVVTPKGKTVWSAHTGRKHPTLITVLPAGHAANVQVTQINGPTLFSIVF